MNQRKITSTLTSTKWASLIIHVHVHPAGSRAGPRHSRKAWPSHHCVQAARCMLRRDLQGLNMVFPYHTMYTQWQKIARHRLCGKYKFAGYTSLQQPALVHCLRKLQSTPSKDRFGTWVVSDNHKINVAAMETSRGQVETQVTHPINDTRNLVLALNQSYIMKNTRSEFLATKKLQENGKFSWNYINNL